MQYSMMSMIPDGISARLEMAGIIAVLIIDRDEDAVLLPRTLVDDCITAMEMALPTGAAPADLSAICREVSGMLADPGAYSRDQICSVASWFYATGITPAISRQAAEAVVTAARYCREQGITNSCDVNFRKKLWN